MPYNAGGGYYGQGDYYSQGDLFGFLKGAAKTVGRIGGAIAGATPVGRAVQTAVNVVQGLQQRGAKEPPRAQLPMLQGRPQVSGRGVSIGGSSGVRIGSFIEEAGPRIVETPAGPVVLNGKKRRRINPMNPKALRRASTRIDRFARSVRQSLKHTQYRLARRGASPRGGSPGLITRSEAARALRK